MQQVFEPGSACTGAIFEQHVNISIELRNQPIEAGGVASSLGPLNNLNLQAIVDLRAMSYEIILQFAEEPNQ
jgi:hypothetical protein